MPYSVMQEKAELLDGLGFWGRIMEYVIEGVDRFEDETGMTGSCLHEARSEIRATIRRLEKRLSEIELQELNHAR